MEVNIYFAREMDIKGKTHKVLQRKNMGSLVELRYRKMLNAKMMYTENGEIIIRIKRKGKVIYSLLKNINDADTRTDTISKIQTITKQFPLYSKLTI